MNYTRKKDLGFLSVMPLADDTYVLYAQLAGCSWFWKVHGTNTDTTGEVRFLTFPCLVYRCTGCGTYLPNVAYQSSSEDSDMNFNGFRRTKSDKIKNSMILVSNIKS